FTPKSSSLPLYPGSYWLRFLGLFGSVQSSTLLFTEPQSEAMGLTAICVKFRDHKAIRQALLVLYNRYLLHPKKADEGMKLSWIRPVNYARVLRESSAAAGHGEATTGDGKGTPEASIDGVFVGGGVYDIDVLLIAGLLGGRSPTNADAPSPAGDAPSSIRVTSRRAQYTIYCESSGARVKRLVEPKRAIIRLEGVFDSSFGEGTIVLTVAALGRVL
ncbi:26S protease regulatory subunit 7, partial [Perkinsus olseni]